MTKVVADQSCTVCNGMLVPPSIATRFVTPPGMDYVCVKCGRAFQWVGNPPRLTLLSIIVTDPGTE
jgi:hypothetical protein